ncbi:MAG: hypothetical protein IMW93_10315, partial [Thermoanaerobacteraceae bacterium]|nr:hypothetical protein [Thermoanaerobacteraceae bacterium]
MVNHKVTVFLNLYERVSLPEAVRAEDVRRLGDMLKERHERVAAMMDLLQAEGFSCRAHRQAVILEGSRLEAYQVKELLQKHGFRPDEYEIKLEYTRQWGI